MSTGMLAESASSAAFISGAGFCSLWAQLVTDARSKISKTVFKNFIGVLFHKVSELIFFIAPPF
jgi:hypothetical protein